MSAMPSEDSITNALEDLRSAPGKFQRVAEDIMKIKFGGAYNDLRPQGRNAKDQTTKGYPDAYVRLADGRYCIVEVTVGDWRVHLDDDLSKLAKLGQNKVAEIAIFVIQNADLLIPQKNANKEKTEKSEEYYRGELEKLGIPPEGVRFFFLNQIVREIRQPRYAQILNELGLPVSVSPFQLVSKIPSRSPSEPTLEEYQEKRVIAATRYKALKRALTPHSAVVITGLSGVGKTTLAVAAAHAWSAKPGRPSIYLDLQDYGQNNSLIQDIVRLLTVFGSGHTLFVVDNCHLMGPRLLSQIVAAHRDANDRPTLLLVTHALDFAVEQSLKQDRPQSHTIINVKLDAGDIGAAYRLICHRIFGSYEFYRPSRCELENWLQIAPDLLTFSLALQDQKEAIQSGLSPSLSSVGARSFVEQNYISGSSAEDREALAVIALCATYEMPASLTSLSSRVPDGLMKRRLVFEMTTRYGVQKRYRLAHDKLGNLILDCLSVDRKTLRDKVLAQDSFQASFWVRRQLDRESPEEQKSGEAKEVLEKIGDRLWNFNEQFSPGYVHTIASMYAAAGVEQNFWCYLPDRIRSYIDNSDNFLKGISNYLEQLHGHAKLREDCWRKLNEVSSTVRFERACLRILPMSLASLLVRAKEHGDNTLEWFSRCITSDRVASVMTVKFRELSPDAIERVLELTSQFAPDLYKLIDRELLRSDLLAEFKKELLAANDFPTSAWVKRRYLFELLLKTSGSSLLASSFASSRFVSLELLLLQDGPFPFTSKLASEALDHLYASPATENDPRKMAARLVLMARVSKSGETEPWAAYVQRLQECASLGLSLRTLRDDRLVELWKLAQSKLRETESFENIRKSIDAIVQQRLTAKRLPADSRIKKLNELKRELGLSIAAPFTIECTQRSD